LASVLNDPDAAIKQRFFNCGTENLVTYDEVAYMCAEAAGIPEDKVMIEHYDHELFGKATFPFRMTGKSFLACAVTKVTCIKIRKEKGPNKIG
jgi:nucleoside-diphosphate-sugar epimerase